MLSEENTPTTEERVVPCFVRHPDAGGLCWEPGVREVHGLSFCGRHGLEAELGRLREESEADLDHRQALIDAYPFISDKARDEIERWRLVQSPDDELPVLDILLMNLHAMHKLSRIAHSEGMTWLVEVLDQERQYLAVQAAYLLRNPDPPEPDDED